MAFFQSRPGMAAGTFNAEAQRSRDAEPEKKINLPLRLSALSASVYNIFDLR